MKNVWDIRLISDLVSKHAISLEITRILTFDRIGISSHPNHIAAHYGVLRAMDQIPTVSVWTLTSVSLLRKFSSILDSVICINDIVSKDASRKAVFASSPISYWRGVKAMVFGHRSQLVWFRYLYLIFSRYMWLNEWKEVIRK